MSFCAPSAVAVRSPLMTARRYVSTGRFDHPPYSYRQRHTFNTLPIHDANYFGGRLAQLREIGPVDIKKRGRQFKRNKELAQYSVDVWCAQQTLRKRWKARDWDVVEMPFHLAPKELQRVVPELYTDVPVMANAAAGDCSNLRSKVYAVEDLQDVLFGNASRPFPLPKLVNRDSSTLDKFL